jgi:hypothetical protein
MVSQPQHAIGVVVIYRLKIRRLPIPFRTPAEELVPKCIVTFPFFLRHIVSYCSHSLSYLLSPDIQNRSMDLSTDVRIRQGRRVLGARLQIAVARRTTLFRKRPIRPCWDEADTGTSRIRGTRISENGRDVERPRGAGIYAVVKVGDKE